MLIITESTGAKLRWMYDATMEAFHYVTHQAKYSGPQCISSHPVNGACNSLSCTIRLCVIRSDRSSMLRVHTTVLPTRQQSGSRLPHE